MSPIQQMLLGVGAVATKTYVDDVFSTFLYEGNGSSQSINNGINLSGEGGMVWVKDRDSQTYDEHALTDTLRGIGKELQSNSNIAETTQTTNRVTAFNSNGFTVGEGHRYNKDDDDYASWTFRKAKGFFDVVKYTAGNGTTQSIAHNLGCVPGCIMVKRLTGGSESWAVYHKNMSDGTTAAPGEKACELDTNSARKSSTSYFTATLPTATHFYVGSNNGTGASGEDYVAYLFAGGESTAATARSVDFDGSGDYLEIDTSSDFAFGTGDYTIEFWMYKDATGQGNIYEGRDGGNTNRILFYVNSNNKLSTYINASQNNSSTTINPGQWYHCALSRQGSTNRMFLNGTLENSWSDSVDVAAPSGHLWIGQDDPGSNDFNGKISNLRVVKGTAVYTSSFRPPTEPLTNITNTKLLCCNNSSITGSTVTPATISANGDPTASTDSPFDDPTGFVFGDAGDQNVIKTGSFVGNAANGLEVNIGWEPSWVLIKNASATEDWFLFDNMRGVTTGGNDNRLQANSNGSEFTTFDYIDFTSTGFKVNNNGGVNGDGNTMIYIAIRRPDGYVGKPPELGTGVFAMDTGNSSTTIPTFDSGFPLDFALLREPASSGYFYSTARLMSKTYIFTNGTSDQNTASTSWTWDSNTGWNEAGYNTDWVSWMWKRHAGFDVVTYKATGVATDIRHSLGRSPQMIWIKSRDETYDWMVNHIGLNGGTDYQDYGITLNSTAAESATGGFGQKVPTSTHFSIGVHNALNTSGKNYIAMLFASVDGISKLGYYDGSSSDVTVTTGFQPRFVIIKKSNGNAGWFVTDTIRGWTASSTNTIKLNANAAQAGNSSFSGPISTGFTVSGGHSNWNASGNKYIYYAHS